MFTDREIQIVDSMSASMGEGMLAELGVEMAATGASATEIAATLERRRDDLQVYLALETLEYLKRGGRISGAQAAIGTLLSVKPIIEIKDGKVETAERVRTRGKARERLIELFAVAPDRAPVDPAHDRRRRRGVRRRSSSPRSRRHRPLEGHHRPRRAVGRAAPRPGLRRRASRCTRRASRPA